MHHTAQKVAPWKSTFTLISWKITKRLLNFKDPYSSVSLLCIGLAVLYIWIGYLSSRRRNIEAIMYYQFNNFTGRLIGISHIHQPYFPISTIPLNKNEPPKIQFATKDMKVAKENARSMASQKLVPGTNKPYGSVPQALLAKMERFQRNDGLPVHLKGGPVDRILFGLTAVLCVVGIGAGLQFIYVMSYPKRA